MLTIHMSAKEGAGGQTKMSALCQIGREGLKKAVLASAVMRMVSYLT